MIGEEYLKWYYNSNVWRDTQFLGVHTAKSVSDMWNYQEIIFELKPKLIVEFGSHMGGSALFFSNILSLINQEHKVFSVDISHASLTDLAKNNPDIEFLESSSTDKSVQTRIDYLRDQYKGPVFFILDSDHTKKHVYSELELIRSVTKTGDYIIVEDGIVNGNPVVPEYGEGPLEAVKEYLSNYPNDYMRDLDRENKFGFTFAPFGFLKRI
ncbi:UNVERIFIED_CONTAM: hypothetical protein GTU68_000802 [Idotea baltica]|nr:hypothetical protein [Idotea baltica]